MKKICKREALSILLIGMLSVLMIFNFYEGNGPETIVSDDSADQFELDTAQMEEHHFTMINVSDLDFDSSEHYILSSIKGIMNENGSNLYVIDDSSSNEWFTILNNTPYIGTEEPVSTIFDVIDLYEDNITGVILFNGTDAAEANIATSLAGVYNALMVPNDYYSTCFIDPLPIQLNLTDIFKEKTTRLEKYQYAYNNYFSLCNQSALALFPGSASRHLRSFLVANNIFTLWQPLYVYTEVADPPLYPDPLEERLFFEKILDETAENIPIYGYMWPDGANEGEVIKLISAANKHLIPSDWISNLAFHSGMKLPEGYSFSQDRSADPIPLEDKIYVTGLWSDGDNIQYVQNFMRSVLWNSDTPHGLVPTGWTINPQLYSLAPYVAKYFYDSATENDYFVGGLSGVGYCKLDYYTDMDVLEDFLGDSQKKWDLMDMEEARLWMIDETAELATRTTDLNGIFDSYGGGRHLYEPRVVQNTPILKSVGIGDKKSEPIDFIRNISRYNLNRPVFVFFHMLCWDCRTEIWTDIVNELESMGDVDVVRPDQICNLIELWAQSPVIFIDEIATAAVIFGGIALVGASIFAKPKSNQLRDDTESRNEKKKEVRSFD